MAMSKKTTTIVKRGAEHDVMIDVLVRQNNEKVKIINELEKMLAKCGTAIKLSFENCPWHGGCPICGHSDTDTGPYWVMQNSGQDICWECGKKYAPKLFKVAMLLNDIDIPGDMKKHNKIKKILKLLGAMN